MGEFDNSFKILEELSYEIKNSSKPIKETFEDKLEENFNLRLEEYFEDKKSQNIIGKYDDYIPDSNARIVRLKSFLDDCVRLSSEKYFKEGDKLYMNKNHAKKLLEEAKKLFKYQEDNMLRNENRSDTQAYLSERSIGRNGENKEATMQGIKVKIQKINILEALASGERVNYSSNIKTPEELSEFKGLKQSQPKNNDKNKQMSDEDYNKIFNPLFEKLQKDPKSVTEAEAAFLLAGEFGFRPSTVVKIDISAVDVKKGTIDIYEEDNKSKQIFQAKTSAIEPDDFLTQQLLSGLRERALLTYKPDKDGNIKLVNCCEQNLHQGFSIICKKYGVNLNKYSGKYKILRHRFAQKIYTEVRQLHQYDSLMNETQKKTKALVETNYLIGHSKEKLTTTMGYIKNLW